MAAFGCSLRFLGVILPDLKPNSVLACSLRLLQFSINSKALKVRDWFCCYLNAAWMGPSVSPLNGSEPAKAA
jgi:hypothetical protein